MTRRYRFDDVEIDLQGYRLIKAGKVVQVEPKALNLLIFLVERPGQLVARREIIDTVWKEAFVTDHVLNRVIGQLRKGLSDDAKEPRYIETVPTLGYRFIAEVEAEQAVPASTDAGKEDRSGVAAGAAGGTLAAPKGMSGGVRRPRWVKTAMAIAVILVCGLAIAFAVMRWRSHFEFYRAGFAAQITNFPGLSNYPAFSPDNTTIAYSRDDGKGFEIYVRPLAGEGKEIQVTSDGGQNLESAWSPDGKLLAYYSYGKGGIWLVPPLGGPARQLSKFGSHPEWSPDGQWIVFQSNPISNLSFEGTGFGRGSTIWVIHPDGTGAREVTPSGTPAGGHGDPSWSPNGGHIVFASEDEPYEGLWSIKPDGTGLVNLTPNGSSFMPHDPVYLPDGKSVLYGGYQGLWQVHVSLRTSAPIGDPVQITNPTGTVVKNLAMSRDGKRLLYSAQVKTSELQSQAMSVSGEPVGSPVELRPDWGCSTSLAEFSPDGKHIAYFACHAGGPGAIWMMDPDGGHAEQLTSVEAVYCAPSWYPDSKHVLYLTGASKDFKLFSVDSESRQEQLVAELHQNVGRVALSPDGKQVVFDSNAGGAWNIWMLELATGETKQITFQGDALGFPLWSRDGKLVSADVARGEDTNIMVLPASGGNIVQLTSDPGDHWSGDWSSDGDKILFARRPAGGFWNVWSVSLSTKVERQITHYTKLNSDVYAPVISPRGDQIVYEYNEITGNIWMLDLNQPSDH
jgi:Tol biopolymer transport system component/DNA-binding winged helix-turn-helix (wHTH) protein